MSWKPEVIADSSGKWLANALCFATKIEAEQNARNLMMRWMAVTDTRAVEGNDPVNYQFIDGALVPVTTEGSTDAAAALSGGGS